MLEVKDATIAVGGKTLVKGLSLLARDGQMTCITGPEGSGKTILIRTLMGFLPVVSGFVSVDGELLTPLSSHAFRRMMCYLPQELRLLAHQLHEPEAPDSQAVIDPIWGASLPKVGPETSPEHLSPEGIFQLAKETLRQESSRPIILADEPIAYLTPELAAQLVWLLRQQAESGKTVVVTSRYPMLLEQADQVVRLGDPLL